MAHYDCSDCGASMGICYGKCTDCTPAYVIKAGKEADAAFEQAKNDWDARHNDEKYAYAREQSAELRKVYDILYKAGKKK